MTGTLKLYSYWRSSAAYRVRIALNLKRLDYEIVPVHLTREGGEQHADEFRALNPQELIPVLRDGHRVIRQSLAIIEYLDETWASPPLLPATARDRARVRALADVVACDIHPLNNLRVLQYFERVWNVPQPERDAWVRHWIALGLEALESMLVDNPSTGDFCDGDSPTLADCCVVPQLYNAKRFGLELDRFPTLLRVEAECLKLSEFDRARPENQPDFPDPQA